MSITSLAGPLQTGNAQAFAAALAKLLPACASASIVRGINSSHCGEDVTCYCESDYASLLIHVVQDNCTEQDGTKTINVANSLCQRADPSLLHSRQPAIIAIVILIILLATMAVVARLISRRISGLKFWWDDYMIIVALVLTLGLNADDFYSLWIGFGKHLATLSLDDFYLFEKNFALDQLLFAFTITPTKISLLLFYLRIFPSKKFHKAVFVAMGLVIAEWICQTLLVVFSCWPIQYAWNKSIRGGHCIDLNSRSYGITVATFVTDIIVWVLPLPSVLKLQTPLPRRLQLIGLFMLGAFVCIASIVRLPLLLLVRQYDINWTVVDVSLWINVECNLGIVCACLPIMRPVLQSVRSWFSSVYTGTTLSSSHIALGDLPAEENSRVMSLRGMLARERRSGLTEEARVSPASQRAEDGLARPDFVFGYGVDRGGVEYTCRCYSTTPPA